MQDDELPMSPAWASPECNPPWTPSGYLSLTSVFHRVGRYLYGAAWKDGADDEQRRTVQRAIAVRCSEEQIRVCGLRVSGSTEAVFFDPPTYSGEWRPDDPGRLDDLFAKAQLAHGYLVEGEYEFELCWVLLPETEVLTCFPETSSAAARSDQVPPMFDEGSLYLSPYMQLMLDALATLKLTEENQHNADALEAWFTEEMEGRGLPKSQNLARAMATLVRHPDMQKGRGAQRGRVAGNPRGL